MFLTRESDRVEVVFFDIGNTLLYPRPSVPEVFIQEANKLGASVDPSNVYEQMKQVDAWYECQYENDGDFWCSPRRTKQLWLTMYQMLSSLTGLEEHGEEISQAMYEAYTSASYWHMFDDVQPCLQALRRRGVRIGAVSNWGSNLEDLLRSMGMLPYFDDVVASAVVGFRKPDSAMYELACERMGVDPRGCVHVGDLLDADGDGPASVGVTPVLIDRRRALTDIPYKRMDSLCDLVSFL